MLKKIMIGLLFIGFTVALLFGIWYLTTSNGWPLWVGASILAGTIGLILGFVFLRRYLLRANERKFVKRVIAQEGDSIFATEKESSLLVKDLEHEWEKSIQRLYSSKLGKGKSSIYALPWIVVMGESGAGKTSLIKNSRLSSALTDVEASSQYAGTKNCDWWFFEDAIILDTAGRYSVPVEEQRDNAEWERFLSLLSKYRKEEPLNGVVITLSVERLLENDKDLIQEEALSIRKKIDQLMISIGVKFPVYVMISKMDYIYGFTDFCDSLPEELQTQAMGYLNESANENWDEVIDESIDFVKEKIAMLQLLSVENRGKHSKETLLFSKEFSRIVPALKDFSSIVFGDNPYQKIPMLRGVYFSSALSDGEAHSEFLEEFKLATKRKEKKNRAYFITDFFKVVLPSDRNVFQPIKEYLSWQSRNYKIALFAWLFLFFSLMGLYTYSYIQNIKVIADVKYVEKFGKDFEKMDITSRVIAIDQLRLDINKIHALNENILLPFLNFKQSQKAEKNLKILFHQKFNSYLYREFLFRMNEDIDRITDKTPSSEVVSYIGFLIDSIDVLKQVLQEKEKDEIEVSPHFSTWIKNILFKDEKSIEKSVSLLFVNSYIAYQEFNDDKGFVKEEIKNFQNLIIKIVNKKGSDLYWLTDEGVSQTPSITMEDFFQGINKKSIENYPTISGSLTAQGRKNLVENINVLVATINNDKRLQKNLDSFWQWYESRFYYRWKNFAMSFSHADKFLEPENKEQLLYAMASDQNPDFHFIHTMATELKAYKPLGTVPEWTKLVIEIDTIMSIAKDIRNSKNSLLAKVGSETDKIVAKAASQVDKDSYIQRIKSAEILNKYIETLTKFSKVVDKKESQRLIVDFFSSDTQKPSSEYSFSASHNYYKQFIHSLPYFMNTDFIYKIIDEPKNYIIEYAMIQMEDVLNAEWQSNVVGAIPLSSDHDMLMSLFNKQKGLVWKYVHNELKPFVRLTRYGYMAKDVSGYKLPIRASFLRYINSGINLLSAYKPEYNISITALPFDVNRDAKIEPNYVNLHLRCAKSDSLLKNENYNLTKEFQWIPQKCGETTLTVGFSNFKVKRIYRGENGFLYFLKDFRTGTKTFKLNEFDVNSPQLKQNNIKFIRVSYNIANEGDILKLLDKTPYNVPKKVVGF